MLVAALLHEVKKSPLGREMILYADIPGESCPPLINSTRPDLFGRHPVNNSTLIGEAKTEWDLDRLHSLDQFNAFLTHLSESSPSEFWLGVPWMCVGTAMRLLRNARAHASHARVPTRVCGILLADVPTVRVWHG